MSTTKDYFTEAVPSQRKELLQSLIGSTVQNLIRCSWDTFEEFDKDELYGISESDFFRFTSGAIVLILDQQYEIAFSSQEDISSITVWVEKNTFGQTHEEYYATDEDLFLIGASNEQHTTERERNLSDQVLKSISILVQEPKNAKFIGLPNEVGLLFEFQNNEQLLLAHNLVQSSDSFAIAYFDGLSEEVKSSLTAIKIV